MLKDLSTAQLKEAMGYDVHEDRPNYIEYRAAPHFETPVVGKSSIISTV